jgi:hypothetical protein
MPRSYQRILLKLIILDFKENNFLIVD